jgi:hypothetical protein
LGICHDTGYILKRVLIIRDDDLITGAIASLLQQADSVILLNKIIKTIPHLISEINDLRPGILVLKNSLEFEFSNTSSMMDLLSKLPDLQILVIDESKNIIHVYEKQEFHVTHSTDLLRLIEEPNI